MRCLNKRKVGWSCGLLEFRIELINHWNEEIKWDEKVIWNLCLLEFRLGISKSCWLLNDKFQENVKIKMFELKYVMLS